MNRLLLPLLILIGLVACAKESYISTSENLLGVEVLSDSAFLFKSWIPRGKKYDYNLTEGEEKNRDIDLSECVKFLESNRSRVPIQTVRAAEITQCMNEKKWQFQIEEIIKIK